LAAKLDDRVAAQIVEAVDGATLLSGALANPDAFGESSILQLAEHFGDTSVVQTAHAIAAARLDEDDWRRKELDEIRDRVLTALAHPDLRTGADTLVESRRRAALASLGPHADGARSRLETASPTFLMSHDPVELARQASLVGRLPRRGVVRVVVSDGASADTYRIDVSCRDRPGLLARLTDALASSGLDVVTASLTTWPDGGVLDSFVVRGATRPDPGVLTERMERRLTGRVALTALADFDVAFDDAVLPWHTQCVVRGPDRRGLLAAIAAAFDSAKVDVHAARVGTGPDGEGVANRFQVTDRHGRKLDQRTRASVLAAFDRAGERSRR
jgi:UTP:GlnB (protein PII) uridylyltransferase